MLQKEVRKEKWDPQEIHPYVDKEFMKFIMKVEFAFPDFPSIECSPKNKLPKVIAGHHHYISFDLSKALFNVGFQFIVPEFNWDYVSTMYDQTLEKMFYKVKDNQSSREWLRSEKKAILIPCVNKYLRP